MGIISIKSLPPEQENKAQETWRYVPKVAQPEKDWNLDDCDRKVFSLETTGDRCHNHETPMLTTCFPPALNNLGFRLS